MPGPRQVQVLPTNSLSTNETTIIQPTQVRTLPNQQQTTATTTPPPPLPPSSPSTNRSPTPTNIQVRTPTLQRTSSQVFQQKNTFLLNSIYIFLLKTTIIPTLEVRTQLPTSPKPQQTSTRPSSTTARPPSASQSSIDYVIQSQPKTLTTTATTVCVEFINLVHRSIDFFFLFFSLNQLFLLLSFVQYKIQQVQ